MNIFDTWLSTEDDEEKCSFHCSTAMVDIENGKHSIWESQNIQGYLSKGCINQPWNTIRQVYVFA